MNINNKKSGLSLLELSIVMVLISVILTMGFQAFTDTINKQHVKGACEQIAEAIQKAKYYSRVKGVVTSLSFLAGANQYSISANGATITSSNIFDNSSGISPGNLVIIQNTCPDINFNVEGSLVNSSGTMISTGCSITVGYTNGHQQTIKMEGNTGNVN